MQVPHAICTRYCTQYKPGDTHNICKVLHIIYNRYCTQDILSTAHNKYYILHTTHRKLTNIKRGSQYKKTLEIVHCTLHAAHNTAHCIYILSGCFLPGDLRSSSGRYRRRNQPLNLAILDCVKYGGLKFLVMIRVMHGFLGIVVYTKYQIPN